MAEQIKGEVLEKINKIIEYLSNPLDTRTAKEFHESEGISETAYYRYLRENREYITSRVDSRRKEHESELRAVGYKALMRRIGKSDNSIKLLFQLLGDLVERTESRTEVFTMEQKKQRINELLDMISSPLKRPELGLDSKKESISGSEASTVSQELKSHLNEKEGNK